MSEQTLVSRRSILTLAGGSVIGAAAMSASGAPALADDRIVANAQLINAQPIPPPVGRAQIAAVVPGRDDDFGSILVTRVPRYVLTSQPMVMAATILVDKEFVGQQYTCLLYTSPSPRDS